MLLIISILSFMLFAVVIMAILSTDSKKAPIERLMEAKVEVVAAKDKVIIGDGPIKRLSRLIPKAPKSYSKLQENLIYADSKYSLEEVLTVKILSSSAISFLALALTRRIFIASLMLLIVWFIPNFYVARKAQARIDEFNSQIGDGLLIISNALKAGYSFMQAMSLVAKEMDGPFAKEFTQMLKEMAFGLTMEESFNNISHRVKSEDLNLVINAILIQKDVGGNLSEILDKIVDTIRERQKLKGEVRTLTAQGRLSGIIIALLPIALALFLFTFNKEYLMTLINNPVGIGMIVYGAISQCIGYFFITRITDIEL